MLVSGIPDLGSYDCYNSCCCDKILNKKKLRREENISVHHVGKSTVTELAHFLGVVC